MKTTSKCRGCEIEFIPTDPRQKFHSTACAKRNSGKKQIPVNCEKCGKEFMTNQKSPAAQCPDCRKRRTTVKEDKKPTGGSFTGSMCWSCGRAYALPDPCGCAFHRKGHVKVFEQSEIKPGYSSVHSGQGREYPLYVVTKCKNYTFGRRQVAI